ncbi:hypothetical protein KHQ82_09650 [Mycoplasmatota bacterium]|nr:hypothetical protein KHQ82_09650 [Mycoplasmatota bacterium]
MLKRLLFYFIGMTLIGFGVGFILLANVGVGPWDLFMANIVAATKSNFTTLFGIQSVILVTAGYILRKEKPNIGVLLIVITALYIGYLIDLILDNFNVMNTSVYGYIALISALVVINIGINIARITNIILPSIDFFVESLHIRTGISFGRVKQLIEFIVLVLGLGIALLYDLPNKLWFGTIIILVCGGPLVNLFYSPVKKFLGKFNL